MTLGELRAMVLRHGSEDDDKEVKVWLPGSTIRLDCPPGKPKLFSLPNRRDVLCFEGNVDPGSALMRD